MDYEPVVTNKARKEASKIQRKVCKISKDGSGAAMRGARMMVLGTVNTKCTAEIRRHFYKHIIHLLNESGLIV